MEEEQLIETKKSSNGGSTKILLIVLAVLIVFSAYFFGFRNLTAMNDKLDSEIKVLNTRYSNLKIMEANVDQYEADTVTYNSSFDNIVAQYDTGYSQEHSIMFINDMEKTNETWVSNASLGDSNEVYTFGQITSTNPYGDGGTVYTSDYKGYQTVLGLTYRCTYEDFKKLLDYINNYDYKCTIESLSAAYEAGSGLVMGNITLDTFAITGEDRPFDNETINGVTQGTENIFLSEYSTDGSGSDSAGNNIITDYDLYLTLQSSTSNVGALTIGLRNDASGVSVIKNADNTVKDVTIKFTGTVGSYCVSYEIDGVTFPQEEYEAGALFEPGDILSILVPSSSRTDDDDLSGANVTLINESDMQLQVKVTNDDPENPRFVLEKSEGDVVVY